MNFYKFKSRTFWYVMYNNWAYKTEFKMLDLRIWGEGKFFLLVLGGKNEPK